MKLFFNPFFFFFFDFKSMSIKVANERKFLNLEKKYLKGNFKNLIKRMKNTDKEEINYLMHPI